MSTTDRTLAVRRAVVAHLKSYAPLTAYISAPSIYGEQPPTNAAWPFIKYSSTTLPYEATCWSGSTHLVSIHVFCNGPFTDAVLNASAAVVEAMKVFDGDVEWDGNIGPLQDIPVGEASKWHVVVQFRIVDAG